MKKITFRASALILALLMLLPVLAACNTEPAPEVTTAAPEPSATEAPATETPETEAPKVYVTVNGANAPAVAIVRSDKLSKTSTELNIYTAFRKEMAKRFGASFELSVDFIPPGSMLDPNKIEIIIGNTDRAETAALGEKLAATGTHAFGITVTGNKIAVNGTGTYLLYKGLDYLMEKLTAEDEAGKLQLKLEDGFEYIEKCESDYPDPEEVINSGREYVFYTMEKIARIPTKGAHTVVQGGGSDGKYAYYAVINKATTPESAVIHKFDMSTWEVVATSKSMPSGHTNDITYDSKNHRLVISFCSASDGYKGLVFVNPDTLEFLEYTVCPTANRGVSYLPETNQYLLATGYTFQLTNDKFETISSTVCGFPERTTQGFYCDGKLIYDPRWKSGSKYQIITINTLDGQFIKAVELHNIEGEPENIFRDGNSFIMGCNQSNAVFRLALLYKNWWE